MLKKSIFTKKYGTMTLAGLIGKITKYFLLFYLPIATVAFISNSNCKSNNYAAILLSAHAITDYDHWAPPIAFLGSYPAWTFYFNNKRLKTDYIFSATKQDFMNILQDEKYQSIVLVGHGSFNCWRATDALVDNYDIQSMQDKFKQKNGEWFQLTCPEKDYSKIQLGELVMAHGKSYYYNGRSAGNLDFVLDALTAFKHIKNEAKKRELPRNSPS